MIIHKINVYNRDIIVVENDDWTFNKPDILSEFEWIWSALKPALEPITVARKPLSEKTVAENVLKYGTGGINIDESRVGTTEELNYGTGKKSNVGFKTSPQNNERPIYDGQGRFPANIIHDGSDEVVELFPNTKSQWNRSNVEYKNPNKPVVDFGGGIKNDYNDAGSASRFFYCAKASKSERNMWCEELPLGDPPASARSKPAVGRENALGNPRANNHPTVKPIALMEYLVKLVSKEWAIVLDPFAWSGSTLIACKRIDRQYIGIEMTEEYIPIIEARLNAVVKEEPEQDLQPSLF